MRKILLILALIALMVISVGCPPPAPPAVAAYHDGAVVVVTHWCRVGKDYIDFTFYKEGVYIVGFDSPSVVGSLPKPLKVWVDSVPKEKRAVKDNLPYILDITVEYYIAPDWVAEIHRFENINIKTK